MYSATKVQINLESPSRFCKKKQKLNEKQTLLNKKTFPHHAKRQLSSTRLAENIAIYDDYSMVGSTNLVLQSYSCSVKITFKEDHFSRRGGGSNKEIELLLLLGLDVLNMGHSLIHIFL